MGGSFISGFEIGAIAGGFTAWAVSKYESNPTDKDSKAKQTERRIEKAVEGTIGKIWSLPNTVVGILIGMAGMPFGAHMRIGDNAIEFLDYPWGDSRGAALTLGNVILYHNGVDALGVFVPFNPDTQNPRYDLTAVVRVGSHEMAHTLQAQVLGVFYIPVYLLSPGSFSAASRWENAADNYAQGVGGWR